MPEKPVYYDGTKLLSMLDASGQKPEVYLACGNRSTGKTTYFNRLVVNRFLKKKSKFALIYRFSYELDDVADKFFKDIRQLFFSGYRMTSEKRAHGMYRELILNDIPCGYAICLNQADTIKKQSHMFSDVDCMLFDEFQSETNKYCSDELTKFISIHVSVARGGGKQVRYVPVYMLSNTVTMLNPYYVAMGISSRLRADTKYLRGDGFVFEQSFNESVADAQKMSGFNRAFSRSDYIGYAAENVYLNDNNTFIEKPEGSSRYQMTLRFKRKNFAVRLFPELGIVYCDDRPDMTFPLKISITTDDMDINYVSLKENFAAVETFRWYFNHGSFRFKNLECKEAILKMLSY